jgi:hypothetical protein
MPTADGKVLTGPGPLLVVWATEYNKHITAGKTPQKAAKHAGHAVLTKGRISDLAAIKYSESKPNDPGLPPGFNFDPSQLFPLDGKIDFATIEAQLEVVMQAFQYGFVPGLIVLAVFAIIDLIVELLNLFSGKPREEDTITVGTRFAHGKNPAAFLVGTQILRRLQVDGIVLSSSDPGQQKILAQIRKHGESLLVAQGVDAVTATRTIDNVWSHTTDENEKLPALLADAPAQPTPPPPPPPGNADPVTCAQVQTAAATVATAIATAATSIPAVPAPIDTRPELKLIADATAKINLAPLTKAVESAAAALAPDPRADAAFKALLDGLVKDGVIDPQLAQLLSV